MLRLGVCAALLLIGHALTSPSSVWADEPRRLTTDGRFKSDPVFLGRSGEELLYVVQDGPLTMRLMRLRLSDGHSEPLHPQETRNELEPAVSLDGRYIAFVQNRGNLSLGMVIQELATGREVDVKPGGGFSGLHSPTFSPDGKQVFYAFPERGRQPIVSVDLTAGNRRMFLDDGAVCNWPHFSPDGQHITFASTRDGNYEVYVANADGSGVRRLTNSPFQDLRPRFSPDGSQIAFTTSRDGNYEVYLMRADGSEQRPWTRHPERDDFPTWHPEGHQLVVVSERRGKHDLYLIPVR